MVTLSQLRLTNCNNAFWWSFFYMITKYHAKYYANLLTTKEVGGKLSSISQSLMSASVDINPYQIDAVLFAFKSPLSKGIVLADEVGLGKTIEAGAFLNRYEHILWDLTKYIISSGFFLPECTSVLFLRLR